MAKTVLIQLKTEDKASKNLKNVGNEVEKLGKKASGTFKKMPKDIDDVQVALNRMGNRFG